MPEANVLYSVTAVVVLGLATWVAVVLKTAKEPWARVVPKPSRIDDDVPLEPPPTSGTSQSEPSASSPGSAQVVAGSATAEADATAESAAVVVTNGDAKARTQAKADSSTDAEPKADAKD